PVKGIIHASNVGLAFTIIGLLTVVLSAWRFRVVREEIRAQQYRASSSIVVAFTLVTLVLAAVVIWYLVEGSAARPSLPWPPLPVPVFEIPAQEQRQFAIGLAIDLDQPPANLGIRGRIASRHLRSRTDYPARGQRQPGRPLRMPAEVGVEAIPPDEGGVGLLGHRRAAEALVHS